jgi:hypothetical protein
VKYNPNVNYQQAVEKACGRDPPATLGVALRAGKARPSNFLDFGGPRFIVAVLYGVFQQVIV